MMGMARIRPLKFTAIKARNALRETSTPSATPMILPQNRNATELKIIDGMSQVVVSWDPG